MKNKQTEDRSKMNETVNQQWNEGRGVCTYTLHHLALLLQTEMSTYRDGSL